MDGRLHPWTSFITMHLMWHKRSPSQAQTAYGNTPSHYQTTIQVEITESSHLNTISIMVEKKASHCKIKDFKTVKTWLPCDLQPHYDSPWNSRWAGWGFKEGRLNHPWLTITHCDVGTSLYTHSSCNYNLNRFSEKLHPVWKQSNVIAWRLSWEIVFSSKENQVSHLLAAVVC